MTIPSKCTHGSLLSKDPRTLQRNRSEYRFQLYGLIAVITGVLVLILLLTSIFASGYSAFQQTKVLVTLELPEAKLDKSGVRNIAIMKKVSTIGYSKVLGNGLRNQLEKLNIKTDLKDKKIRDILSKESAATLRKLVLKDPSLVGTTISIKLLVNGRIDGYFKGRVDRETAILDKYVSPEQLDIADALTKKGLMSKTFNWGFIFSPDASGQRPEAAGLGVAILGSLYMMLVVLFVALPVGVAASIYLEEFAPKNRITDIIEVNISNLAAVPSIVYGILGLAIFINLAQFNQSSPLVGGLVLSLMTLPRIIIPARAALKSVPPSIRDAALGVGASRMQTVFHHVLPLAAPGILTGIIIGLAQALGETAPLLLIGMVAFVREYPAAFTSEAGLFGEASTALPVQVFNWTQRSDPAFVERASGAIIVLLVFLLVMNAVAIFLRRRYERRW
ncbi:MAG: phosphate ABC transporter permease PstA [Planktomarina sp.]|nr:phosphate ABC transporter permease PstA [Planktomarina sp.]MDT2018528.1 phosphate ABC transporter permease PstA [Planktomarina sp.]MDV3050120.1 phosphate ABC transporter permease PstA [Planktomarina sp.]|tara:strand:- start:3368 stop:4708 length:1341 start_codon:yes stop_codon:yes gene_type:complete